MKKGICCIVLSLEPIKFKTITYKRFSTLPRKEALKTLGERIHNNLITTKHSILYCEKNNHNYRLSSSIFPLITYKEANLSLQDLPNIDEIEKELDNIKDAIKNSNVRISIHPSEYNVLATKNTIALENTKTELNFTGWFMDRIGCSQDYNSPINIHVNNMDGEEKEVCERFVESVLSLNPSVYKRLVIENDDKESLWSVKKLYKHFHSYGFPITFDYLHHKCHKDNTNEEEAFHLCYHTWGKYKPLFHYSESESESNKRKHSDYAKTLPNTYDKEIDLDFEFKMKEKSFQHLTTQPFSERILP